MINFKLISSYTTPLNLYEIIEDTELEDEHIGKNISLLNAHKLPEKNTFDIAIIGINSIKGSEFRVHHPIHSNNINIIRKNFYSLYYWHPEVSIIDFGNIIPTEDNDDYSTLKIITEECSQNNLLLIVLGGPHNLTLGQYYGLKSLNQKIHYTNIDAFININPKSRFDENLFLDQIFFDKNSFLKSYSHIGFQSYFTHPKVLEILNSLNFDFYRLGYVKDNLFEIEPQFRSSELVNFDISSIANSFNSTTQITNGFNGEEACLLSRFCGMSNALKTFGIYGYYSFLDKDEKMAMQIAQMLWYFIEGLYYKNREGNFEDNSAYEIFFTSFNEIHTIFYQNKITKRWWMQHQENKKIIPCSYNDYLLITRNEIPDRWIKGFESN